MTAPVVIPINDVQMFSFLHILANTLSFIFWIVAIVTGFPGGSDSKESACNVGYPGSIPGSERSPGAGNSYPLHYSCLENSMEREEPGGLQSMGSQRVRHDWVANTFTFAILITIVNNLNFKFINWCFCLNLGITWVGIISHKNKRLLENFWPH